MTKIFKTFWASALVTMAMFFSTVIAPVSAKAEPSYNCVAVVANAEWRYKRVTNGAKCWYSANLHHRRTTVCDYLFFNWKYYGPWKLSGQVSSTVVGPTCHSYKTQVEYR